MGVINWGGFTFESNLIVEIKECCTCRERKPKEQIRSNSMCRCCTEIEHKLLMSDFMVTMKENGFNIIKVELEYSVFQKDYGLSPDMRVEFGYYTLKFVIFVEVDRTKTFINEEKYKKLIKSRKTDQKVAEILTDKFLLISLCDKKPLMKDVQWLKTDMINFTKFKYSLDEMISAINNIVFFFVLDKGYRLN